MSNIRVMNSEKSYKEIYDAMMREPLRPKEVFLSECDIHGMFIHDLRVDLERVTAERDRLRGDNDRLREIMRMVADSTAATWVCDELRKALEVKP